MASPQAATLIHGLILLIVVLSAAWKFSLPLRSHTPLLGFAQDDFYYYLKAAQNLADRHGSTFDGRTLTNGYHPLYFLFWTVASLCVRNLRSVFQVLWALDVASATTIFLAARRIFRRVTANPLLANAFAIGVLLPCFATISFQMEVTLALPLGLAFLATGFVPPAEYTARRCALLGVLGALTTLARLDAGILVLLFLLALVAIPAMRMVLTPRNAASFSAAALPLLLVYFALNHHYFHEWLPISGAAKQLRHGWKPDWTQLPISFSGFSLLFLAVAITGCLLLALLHRRLAPQEKAVCAAALLMPLLFYALEAFISVWKLWGWYLYALRFSQLAAGLLLLIALTRPEITGLQRIRRLTEAPWIALLLLATTVLLLSRTHYKLDPIMLAIAQEDTALNEFSKTHPGRYAMGDRAGMFGYLSSSPLIQAEGLMMDRAYLQHIQHEDDLVHTLRQYHVDYYVHFVFDADAPERWHRGCLDAQEPSIAGKAAFRMHSLLCDAPVASLQGLGGKLYIYRLADLHT